MSTYNISFYDDKIKLSFNFHQIQFSSNTHLISSSDIAPKNHNTLNTKIKGYNKMFFFMVIFCFVFVTLNLFALMLLRVFSA